MANLDAISVGQLAVRLGLITLEQMQEALEDLDETSKDAEGLLRVLERKSYLTPWQSLRLLKGDLEGYFLGGYRILYKIASGSFGRVYRADDPRTGVVVAIKVLRGRWAEKPKMIDLFEREGKLGMSLKHPNIVEIMAVNCDLKTKQFYIVMEFVEGGNLREILKSRKKLEPLETIRMLEDTATGLAFAYSKGVTHRDMKLTNVLVSAQGHAKLVDFGLAGLNEAMHREAGGQVDRTVDYAGLEKATGVAQGDTRSDIYFLGCVIYEMLTGRSPLEMSKNPHERMRGARFQNVQPLTADEVKAPPSLFRLVETMMALDPHRRYQTPSQLLDAIRDVRRELEGGSATADGKDKTNRSMFVVEADTRLQDAMREGFKSCGFRVLLSADPVRALDRYRQQPYDALIMDVGTVGEDGAFVFDRIMSEAERLNRPCAGVVILSEEQEGWASKIRSRQAVAILTRPVTFKQVRRKIEELLDAHC